MKKVIQTTEAPTAIGCYSQAIQVDKIVYLSGQIPLNPITMTLVEGGIEAQTKQVFENLKAVCESAGGSLDQIVKLTLFLMDLTHFATVNEIMAHYFKIPYPARSTVQIAALPKGAAIEAEAIMVLR